MVSAAEPGLYDDFVQRMRLADATNLVEVCIRLGIVTTCALVVYLVLSSWLVPAWSLVYVLSTALYVTWLRRQGPQISARRYWALLTLHVAIAIWFMLLPLYIMTLGGEMALYIGYSAVCGLALHNMSRRNMTPHVAWSDVGVVLVAGVFVGWQFMQTVPDLGMGVAVMTICVALLGYYLHTFIDTNRMRRRLEEKAAEERQTQKMRAVGQLTAGIAHDFNNILTVIRGNLDLHAALTAEQDREQVLQEARDAAEKAAHLVAQLLAFSRKSKIQPSPRPVTDTLSEFIALAKRTLPANNRIEIGTPLPDIDIIADPTLLQNALLNAAVNARDAMGPEGGTLHVDVHTDTRAPWQAAAYLPLGRYARIVLTDTGPGVPEATLEHLAEPFYTSKPVGKGSGLGLSMIKGFAEQSGGFLHLANAPGRGFQLSLLLPARVR